MSKTILYKLFGIGSIPKKIKPTLEEEGIVIFDEGIRGSMKIEHVNAPNKRYRYRSEGFSGSLIITKKRLLCYSFSKRQINIAIKDPKIKDLLIDIPKEDELSISFESSYFQKDWNGIIEFQFETDKASKFYDYLLSSGAHPRL